MAIGSSPRRDNRLFGRLFQRWQDLPIGVKLRVSISAVVLVTLGAGIFNVQNIFTSLRFSTLARDQQQQITNINQFLTQTLNNISNNALDIVNGLSFDLNAYAQPAAGTAPIDQKQALAALNNDLVLLIKTRHNPTITQASFVNSAGIQLIGITVEEGKDPVSYLEPTPFASIMTNSYFGQLLAQPLSKAYLITYLPQIPTNGVVFVVGVPVFDQGVPIGAFVFKNVSSDLDQLAANSLIATGQALALVDDQNQIVIGINDQGTAHFFDRAHYSLSALIPSSVLNYSNVMPAEQLMNITNDPNGGAALVSARAIPLLTLDGIRNWRVILSSVNTATAIGFSETAPGLILPLIFFFSLLIVAVFIIERALIGPIRRMTSTARQIASGDFSLRMEVASQDEIGQLGQSLNAIMRQTAILSGQMEARVASRTRDVEITAEISRDAASTRDLDTLLKNAVNAIRDQFGFYHVQVFLLDDLKEYAVLVTSTGEAGRQLLARNHKLAVGSSSVIGQATLKNQPVIIIDTQNPDVTYYPNPLLPDTRAEMALPMRVAGEVSGALDVQSVRPNAFDDNNVQTFQVLADQLAIAVNNARLLTAAQKAAQQVAQLNSQLTREGWRELTDRDEAQGLRFAYDRMSLSPIAPDLPAPDLSDTNRTMQAPIVVRGETIGRLGAVEDPAHPLTNEDREFVRSVANRVALAVENARLTERSQSTLNEIELLYKVSRDLSAASNLESVYELIIAELRRLDVADQVAALRAEPLAVSYPQAFTYLRAWDRTTDGESSHSLTNVKIPASAMFFDPARDVRQPYTIDPLAVPADTLTTSRLNLESRSLLFVPVTIGGRWFGMLALQAKRVGAFNDRFIKFAQSLADQMAVAMENRQLFFEAQSEARRSRGLAEAVQASGQIGADFNEGVSKLLQLVAVSADYDRWWFGRLSADQQQLERVTSQGPNDSLLTQLAAISLQVDQTAMGEAIYLNTPVLVNEPDHYLFAGLSDGVIHAYGKHLALPVTVGHELVGAVMVGRDFEGPDLDERDLQLVTTLSNQLAIAVENRRLFDTAETGRATLQSVLDSQPTGVLVIDADTKQITFSNTLSAEILGLNLTGSASYGLDYRAASFPTNQVLQTDRPVKLDTRVTLPSSELVRDLQINAAPIHDKLGKLIGAVAVFTDTTDLRQLEAEIQQNLNETMLLYEANRSISAEVTLDGVLHLVSVRVHDNLQPDALFIILQDEARTARTVYYSLSKHPELVEQWVSTSADQPLPFPADMLSESGETDFSNRSDSAESSTVAPMFDTLRHLRAFPISARNRVVGWLIVGYQSAGDIPTDARRILTGLGDQLAVGAESIRLAEQTSSALRETEALYQANRAINGVLNIPSAADVVREQMMRFRPDRIDIFAIAGRNSDRINWLVRWSALPSKRETQVIETGYITDMDFLSYEPVYVEDLNQATPDQLEVLTRLTVPDDVRAQVSVPIRVKESYLGRIVMTFLAPHRFNLAERQFIETLAEQTAVVMESAILYQQSQESLDETATLYQASRAITDSVDDLGVLQAIVNYGIPAFIARVMFVRLRDQAWEAETAAADVIGDWSRPEAQASVDLTGIHITATTFPAWSLFATPDILYIDDIESAPQLDVSAQALFLSLDIRAFVIAPMIVAGRAIGSLLFGAQEVHEHTEREIRMFGSLTDQSAIAIENRNLLSQAEARARQILTSSQVGQAATSILNLNELLNRTVNLILASFNYDHVQIFLISADNRDAVLQASTGEAGQQLLANHHSLPVGSASVIGRVTAGNALSNVHDTQDPRSVHKPNRFLPNTRSELALPLTARGRVLGALDVQSNRADAFSLEDELILGTLADQIAVAIDNARLFEENQRNIQEIGFLFNVARTAAAVEIDVAVNRVTRQVLDGTGSDLVVLLLTDSEGKRLVSTTAAHEHSAFVIPDTLPLDTGVLSQVQRSRQSLLIDENAGGMLFNAKDVPGLESMVVLPLIVGEKFLGALVVGSTTRFAYSASRVQILETLTSTLSAIIQNAELLRDIQEANARLKEVDGLKSQFLANMSHELRTPLNSIIGFSRVILKGIDGPLTEPQTQDLTTVYDSGRHLLNLVNDILDQAKIEAGKMELAPTFFNVNDLIKAALATATGLLKDKPIRLHQEIQADLPQVFADEFRTNQVLLNILSNAAKFTRQGSITVSAFTMIDGGQPMVQISVTDTGMGISKENIRHVFAQFEQVDNSTARGAEGTGLGMPIAKSLMEMQGGRIWLESEVGVGSTFSITLPTQPPVSAEDQPADDLNNFGESKMVTIGIDGQPIADAQLVAQVEQVVAEAEMPVEHDPRIVVVIDDEPGMINLYRRYLLKIGYEVIGTTNPEEAPILATTYKPRAMLLDVNMPGRTGWEVLQGLKDSDETFRYPVIVCSIEDDKTRGYRLGAADYLVKPFLEEQLIGALKRIELERDLPRILIIDDQPESLRMLREALSVHEDMLRILEAQSGDQGLAMITSHRPDMVIVDLRMPGVDGFAVVDQIRADPETAHLPVLVLTATELSDTDRERLQHEQVEYKVNLTGDVLLSTVRRILAERANGKSGNGG